MRDMNEPLLGLWLDNPPDPPPWRLLGNSEGGLPPGDGVLPRMEGMGGFRGPAYLLLGDVYDTLRSYSLVLLPKLWDGVFWSHARGPSDCLAPFWCVNDPLSRLARERAGTPDRGACHSGFPCGLLGPGSALVSLTAVRPPRLGMRLSLAGTLPAPSLRPLLRELCVGYIKRARRLPLGSSRRVRALELRILGSSLTSSMVPCINLRRSST